MAGHAPSLHGDGDETPKFTGELLRKAGLGFAAYTGPQEAIQMMIHRSTVFHG